MRENGVLGVLPYIKKRTAPILMLFDYQEMDKVDQLLSKFYKLDDEGRETVFKVLSALEMTNLDKERRKKLREI